MSATATVPCTGRSMSIRSRQARPQVWCLPDGHLSSRHGPWHVSIFSLTHPCADLALQSRPQVTTDPNKLEEQAKAKMSELAYSFVGGGAGERATMDANRLAFRQWKLVPRMLQPTTHRDMTVKLFAQTYQSPVLCAPVGVQRLIHPDGEGM